MVYEFNELKKHLTTNNVICGIYKITSPVGKINIGQSVNIMDRWRRYIKYNCVSQTKLYRSFRKYGVEKHIFEIIHICNVGDLNELEFFYIKKYNTFNTENGLNLKIGGDAVHRISDETRKRMSESHKGNTANKGKKMSEESKIKISIASKGKKMSDENKKKASERMSGTNNPMYGKKISLEDRKKASERMMGAKNHMYGKKLSEEHRLSIIERMRGEKNPFLGKKKSDITRKKISEAHKGKEKKYRYKKITQYDSLFNYIKEYESIKKASICTGVRADSISACTRGVQKKAGSFIWK